MTKKELKIADARIDRAFARGASRIPISVFDIRKVFQVGYASIAVTDEACSFQVENAA